jgi:hypothetical protein
MPRSDLAKKAACKLQLAISTSLKPTAVVAQANTIPWKPTGAAGVDWTTSGATTPLALLELD